VSRASARVSSADWQSLVQAAVRTRENAHAPYSRYRVGAALLARSGAVFVGCNVENATYGATICAERAAVVAMVAAGEREPVACVVATGGPEPGAPCGICRQVLAEFAVKLPVLMVAVGARGAIQKRKRASLEKLLPEAFRLRV
jgi:cytidine deaminase